MSECVTVRLRFQMGGKCDFADYPNASGRRLGRPQICREPGRPAMHGLGCPRILCPQHFRVLTELGHRVEWVEEKAAGGAQ